MSFFELKCPTLSYAVRAFQNENGIWISMTDLCAALDTGNLPSAVKTRYLDPKDVMKISFPGSSGIGLFVHSSAIQKFAVVGKRGRGQKIEQWIKQDVEPLAKKRRAKVTPIRPEVEIEAEIAQPSTITPFVFPVTGQSVRAVMVEGKPMFVANEVAEILGYSRPRDAVADHCKHLKLFKGVDSARLTSSPRGITIIPESDVYRLIMRSKLPAAEQFEAWVTETVLPAIRQDGMYVMGEEKVKTGELEETQFLLQAFTMLKNKADRLSQENSQLESKNVILTLENTEMTPKAEMYDRFMDSTGMISITNAGKIFGISRVVMGRFLRDIDWLFQRTDEVIPKQHVLDAGLMGVITGAGENGRAFVHGRLTPEGIEVLFNKYGLGKKAI